MPETLPDPTTNPDLTEAETLRFSDGVLKILPLSSGAWAIYGLGNAPPMIFSDLDENTIRQLSESLVGYGKQQKARFSTEARFYGEPSDKDFLRDLRRERRVPNMAQPTIEDLAIDL